MYDDELSDVDTLVEISPTTPERSSIPQITSPPPVRKSTRPHKPPLWLDDYVTKQTSANAVTVVDHTIPPTFHCFLATLTAQPDPTSFTQALQHPHWIQAMN